jgi:hypothetical protein
MNRIKYYNGHYQVLVSDEIHIAPQSGLYFNDLGFMDNNYILHFDNLNDALYESYKYPDISWGKIIMNHTHEYIHLKNIIGEYVTSSYTLHSHIKTPEELKNSTFDTPNDNYQIFSLALTALTNRKLNVLLHNLRQDPRLHVSGIRYTYKTILECTTDLGTKYEICFLPTIIYEWEKWYESVGYKNPSNSMNILKKYLEQQHKLENHL